MSGCDEDFLREAQEEALAKNPPKTIADLTKEQVTEIVYLAYPFELNGTPTIEYYPSGWYIQQDDIVIRIYPELSVEVVDIREGAEKVTPFNQYKIFELFRQWNVKPI